MDPPLRERLGLRASKEIGFSVPIGTESMARAGLWLAAIAAAVCLAGVALPHGAGRDDVGLLAVAGSAVALALVLLLAFRELPRWSFHAFTALGSLLCSATVLFSGEGSIAGPLPYLFVAMYAFYFFPLRAALVHMALIAGLFAAVLAAEDLSYTPAAGWVVTVAVLTSVGVFVSIVRDRLMGAIGMLTDAARRDPLTKLLNRLGFEEAFDLEIERARRTGQSLSVVVGDLDRFKLINDHFGHAAGDEALRRVADAIRGTKRSWDTAARVGGEEFALLAPDTDEHGAYILAERVRTELERAFGHGGAGPLTCSFGVVSFPVHGQTAEALLLAGDQALYAAKRLGRNRSVISSAEVPGILARAPRGREEAHVELATLLSLAEALDVRDSGTPSHCQRVGRYSELIARELGLPPESVERVRIAGILHDVGRVGVPDELLQKHGPLTDGEWLWIRAHPETGARMLETTEFADIGSWILAHHERPDGTGYPGGRGAGEVPIEAAILGVADAYEAMTAERPYRPPLEPEVATDELRRGSGRQFEQRVVDALLRVV